MTAYNFYWQSLGQPVGFYYTEGWSLLLVHSTDWTCYQYGWPYRMAVRVLTHCITPKHWFWYFIFLKHEVVISCAPFLPFNNYLVLLNANINAEWKLHCFSSSEPLFRCTTLKFWSSSEYLIYTKNCKRQNFLLHSLRIEITEILQYYLEG